MSNMGPYPNGQYDQQPGGYGPGGYGGGFGPRRTSPRKPSEACAAKCQVGDVVMGCSPHGGVQELLWRAAWILVVCTP